MRSVIVAAEKENPELGGSGYSAIDWNLIPPTIAHYDLPASEILPLAVTRLLLFLKNFFPKIFRGESVYMKNVFGEDYPGEYLDISRELDDPKFLRLSIQTRGIFYYFIMIMSGPEEEIGCLNGIPLDVGKINMPWTYLFPGIRGTRKKHYLYAMKDLKKLGWIDGEVFEDRIYVELKHTHSLMGLIRTHQRRLEYYKKD